MLIHKSRLPIRDILLYGIWPGFLKILLYRWRGYRIGRHVSMGFGSVVCGDSVDIGDHVEIGFLTIVRGKRIRLGDYVQIGAMTFLDTPCLTVGEGSRINEQVFVGGLQFPHSRFELGRNCLVQQLAFINPAPSVVVGDDSVIGGHSLIFGHSSWQSRLDGYSVDFGPIEIGNSASLAWRTFVLPHTTIGDGSIVGANSVVSGHVPANSVALGFPARVVDRARKPLTDQEKLHAFGKIVEEMTDFFTASGLACTWQGDCCEVAHPTRGSWMLQVTTCDPSEALRHRDGRTVNVFVSLLSIPPDLRASLDARSVAWIDIAEKRQSTASNDLADEVLRFLQRYGIRTLRSEWNSQPLRNEPAQCS